MSLQSAHSIPDDFSDLMRRIHVRGDEFSSQVSLEGDPLFWCRMEPNGPGEVRFTDFKPGQQSDAVMIWCLAQLIEGCAVDQRLSLAFSDVVPQAEDAAHHRIALTQNVGRVHDWISGLAQTIGGRASDPVLETVHGKVWVRTEIEVLG